MARPAGSHGWLALVDETMRAAEDDRGDAGEAPQG
jgi:hypothetical protein